VDNSTRCGGAVGRYRTSTTTSSESGDCAVAVITRTA
jgi:hypothetical protein